MYIGERLPIEQPLNPTKRPQQTAKILRSSSSLGGDRDRRAYEIKKSHNKNFLTLGILSHLLQRSIFISSKKSYKWNHNQISQRQTYRQQKQRSLIWWKYEGVVSQKISRSGSVIPSAVNPGDRQINEYIMQNSFYVAWVY